MAATYEQIASTTLGSDSGTVTFSSIAADWTDLVVVCDFATTGTQATYFRIGNGSVDIGNNYSQTAMSGNGTSASSTKQINNNGALIANANSRGAGNRNTLIVNLFSYANTSVHKTILTKTASPSVDVFRDVILWRSTTAINIVSFLTSGAYAAGSTFSLYGIKAAA